MNDSPAKAHWLTGKKLLVICVFSFAVLLLGVLVYFLHSWTNRQIVVTRKITTILQDNTEKISQLRKLVLAERITNETVSRTEETKINPGKWWGLEEYIPSSSSAIFKVEVTVQYSYYVDPDFKLWKVCFKDGILYVEAPPLQAAYPVVFTESLKAKCDTGWLVLEEAKKLEEFKREVGKMLQKRAGRGSSLAIVREAARTSLRDFLISWMIRDHIDEVKAIRIKFVDEPEWPGLGGPDRKMVRIREKKL